MTAFKFRSILLLALAVIPVIFLAAAPPLAQPLWYHDFADQRTLLALPHFFNVASNLPFLLVGGWGLWFLARCQGNDSFAEPGERKLYGVFFAAVLLTGIGSAYYHSMPNNERLFWDRLPLTVAFMSLFALIVAERVNYRLGRTLFVPLILLGGGTVIYWQLTENWGHGDMRPYLLVQIYPLLVIPLLLWLYPARFTGTSNLYAALACYVLAKGLEFLDRQIYAQGQIISGHTLKHLLAALGPLFILQMIRRRQPFVSGPNA